MERFPTGLDAVHLGDSRLRRWRALLALTGREAHLTPCGWLTGEMICGAAWLALPFSGTRLDASPSLLRTVRRSLGRTLARFAGLHRPGGREEAYATGRRDLQRVWTQSIWEILAF